MSNPIILVLQLLSGCDGDDDTPPDTWPEKQVAPKDDPADRGESQPEPSSPAPHETYVECIERLDRAEDTGQGINNVVGAFAGSLSDVRGFGAIGAVVEEELNDVLAQAVENLKNEQCGPLSDPWLPEPSFELDTPELLQEHDQVDQPDGPNVIQLSTVYITVPVDDAPDCTCDPALDAPLSEPPSVELGIPDLLQDDQDTGGADSPSCVTEEADNDATSSAETESETDTDGGGYDAVTY